MWRQQKHFWIECHVFLNYDTDIIFFINYLFYWFVNEQLNLIPPFLAQFKFLFSSRVWFRDNPSLWTVLLTEVLFNWNHKSRINLIVLNMCGGNKNTLDVDDEQRFVTTIYSLKFVWNQTTKIALRGVTNLAYFPVMHLAWWKVLCQILVIM